MQRKQKYFQFEQNNINIFRYVIALNNTRESNEFEQRKNKNKVKITFFLLIKHCNEITKHHGF